MRFAVFAAAPLFLAGMPAAAIADPPPIYPSDATCRQWISGDDGVPQSKRTLQDAAYNFWIAGFFDAMIGARGKGLPAPVERGAFLLQLGKYCETFPDQPLPKAAAIVVLSQSK